MVPAGEKGVAVTVRAAEPETPPAEAVIVAVPGASVAALPRLVASLVTVAAAEFDDVHVTASSVCVTPPGNVPVAMNFCPTPAGTLTGAGDTVMDCNAGGVRVVGV
jgi:hypothetical protein